jgi:EAL domain-containing protein (putative c-di-GMP-specific phosphodiesterase class I)
MQGHAIIRCFVRDIPCDRDDIEITAAILSMSHKLNIREYR